MYEINTVPRAKVVKKNLHYVKASSIDEAFTLKYGFVIASKSHDSNDVAL
jgi:hypothetical protein